MFNDSKIDEIGRLFCSKHSRELCHECCMDFGLLNRQAEISAGLLKTPTEIEKLAEERMTWNHGIVWMQQRRYDPKDEKLLFHYKELKTIEDKLNKLREEGKGEEIAKAIKAAELKAIASAAEMADGIATQNENPGQMNAKLLSTIQWLNDKASPSPPSSPLLPPQHQSPSQVLTDIFVVTVTRVVL